jgi:hypothetical protein
MSSKGFFPKGRLRMTRKKKKKYPWEGVKHALAIDPDILAHTMQYVADQIGIMKRHGSAPEPPLTPEQLSDLVYVTAKYPQQIRNLQNSKRKSQEKA